MSAFYGFLGVSKKCIRNFLKTRYPTLNSQYFKLALKDNKMLKIYINSLSHEKILFKAPNFNKN